MAELDDPRYYLANFHQVLDWLEQRYRDLLTTEELAFLYGFRQVPLPSQALLVRMVMRQGELFRHSRLNYDEIGCTDTAMAPLVQAGWVDDRPRLSVKELFRQTTLQELRNHLPLANDYPRASKKDLAEAAIGLIEDQMTLQAWCPGLGDRVYRLVIMPICGRFRLMFFGNLHQDWREFVLTELGLYHFENVPLSEESRAFNCRRDLDDYLTLHENRKRFEDGEATLAETLAHITPSRPDNAWLEERRSRLLFELARHCERLEDLDQALTLYRRSHHPETRFRQIRVLERKDLPAQALALAQDALSAPGGEAEEQMIRRTLPRLHRKLGFPVSPNSRRPATPRLDFRLPSRPVPVELLAAEALETTSGGEVHYVENALITGLFGLLCWDALFAPLPGAFFHPFQSAPADLHRTDFVTRRQDLFNAALKTLEDGSYIDQVRRRYEQKWGIQSLWVNWTRLDRSLLEHALQCIPASHLRLWFQRLLQDVRGHRSGLPDLVQFWPVERRYRLIEVKGPGDRLQDNQQRWLHYAMSHDLPVTLCHVSWQQTTTQV
ncbi:VRR-NUC domain-containing protein [Marinobacteraceae bacterium S3BR75-40.1]